MMHCRAWGRDLPNTDNDGGKEGQTVVVVTGSEGEVS